MNKYFENSRVFVIALLCGLTVTTANAETTTIVDTSGSSIKICKVVCSDSVCRVVCF